jgi:hypothetical protein
MSTLPRLFGMTSCFETITYGYKDNYSGAFVQTGEQSTRTWQRWLIGDIGMQTYSLFLETPTQVFSTSENGYNSKIDRTCVVAEKYEAFTENGYIPDEFITNKMVRDVFLSQPNVLKRPLDYDPLLRPFRTYYALCKDNTIWSIKGISTDYFGACKKHIGISKKYDIKRPKIGKKHFYAQCKNGTVWRTSKTAKSTKYAGACKYQKGMKKKLGITKPKGKKIYINSGKKIKRVQKVE